MSIYKIGWTIVDGVDGNIHGTDRMWFDQKPDEWDVLQLLDRAVEVGGQVGKNLAHNFYWKHTGSTAPEDFKVRYIREDRFRKGDIALVAGRTKIRVHQVRGDIVIARTFGVGSSEAKYFLKDLVLIEAREEK